MGIANSITGDSSSNQLMDLLTVVANPDVYKAKLDALDVATAENKKYVEAIGPASEIVALRDQAKTLRDQAEVYKNSTIAQANADLANATTQASNIVSVAKAKADAMLEAANVVKAQAEGMLSQTQAELIVAQKATADAVKAQAIAEQQAVELAKAVADANAAQQRPRQIVLTITAQGQYAINKSPVGGSSVGALVAVLTPLAKQDTLLVISADAAASHQNVINAMEAARRSGLSKISFAAQAAEAPGS